MKTNKNKKIFILCNARKDTAPGQRFRFEQYLEYLSINNYDIEISCLLTEKDEKNFYSKGMFISKFFVFLKILLRRIKDIIRAREFDIIFIYREVIPLPTVFFEKQLKKTAARIVYDFDDAIFIKKVSEANKFFSFLKSADKVKSIISLSDLVIVGNQYLKNYALKYNNNIKIFPTTIDTETYDITKIKNKLGKLLQKKENICIGWSGSFSTVEHFEIIVSVLKVIKSKYQNKVSFILIGDKNYQNDELGIKGIKWSKATELIDLYQIDIGIMPLKNSLWEQGKCGLKGLQYMALNIPTVMSPVGVNKEIINNGENGYLCDSEKEWIYVLSKLIESKKLRMKIGKEGRKTVVDNFSLDANKDEYVKLFNNLKNNT